MKVRNPYNMSSARNPRAGEEFPEQRLWTAVLAQAVTEWRQGTLRSRRAAETFLFDEPEDFRAVCASAGMNADFLRGRLLKLRSANLSPFLPHHLQAA